MKRLFIFASAIFFHFSSTFSQEWVSLNGKLQREAVNMTVLQSDALGYKVKVTVNGLYDETVHGRRDLRVPRRTECPDAEEVYIRRRNA